MENITTIKVNGIDGVEVEHVVIDRGNGEYTSMLKSTYDEMIANQENGTISQDSSQTNKQKGTVTNGCNI